MLSENLNYNFNFSGTYEHTIDAKNRFLFPSRLREILEKFNVKELLITAALPSEQYLLIFPEMVFQDYIKSWMSVDKGPRNPENIFIERWFRSKAFPVQLDKVGRLLIPPILIEEKKIQKNIYLIGNGNKIEIWDKEAFEKELSRMRETLTKLKFE